jgi:hypothetical protein
VPVGFGCAIEWSHWANSVSFLGGVIHGGHAVALSWGASNIEHGAVETLADDEGGQMGNGDGEDDGGQMGNGGDGEVDGGQMGKRHEEDDGEAAWGFNEPPGYAPSLQGSVYFGPHSIGARDMQSGAGSGPMYLVPTTYRGTKHRS